MQTVGNGSGSCGEQSRLLCALLYSVGEKAYYVLAEVPTNKMITHRFVGINASRPEAAYMSYLTGGKERYVMFSSKMWNGTAGYANIDVGPLLPIDTTLGTYIGDKYEGYEITEVSASWGDYAVVPEFPSGAVLPVLGVNLVVLLFTRRRLFSVAQAQVHP